MNYKKYIFKPFLILFSILFILYLIVFIYVSANKQSILQQVSEKISQKVNGDVSVKNAELSFLSHFPRVAVELNDISVKDSMYAKHKHTFFSAKKLFIYLSVIKLVQKKNALKGIAAEDGQVHFFTDSAGYTNKYLMQGKKDTVQTKNASSNILKHIKLKNFRFIQEDTKREKMIDVAVNKADADISYTIAETHVDVKLDAHVHQLGFNLARGAYLVNKDLKGDFKLRYHHEQDRLRFSNVPMDIDQHRFNINGDFIFGTAKSFVLDIETKQVTMAMGLSVLTQRLAKNISKFKYDKALDITAHIEGPLAGGEPFAKITWAGKNVMITTPQAVFTNASFTGGFNNQQRKDSARNDENSRIEIHGLQANWEGFDFRSDHIYIDNITVPVIRCDIHSDFSLATLNHVLQSSAVELQKGTGVLNIQYSGPLIPEGTRGPHVTGNLAIKNGTALYVPRNILLNGYGATIQFAGSDVRISDMQFNVLKNKFVMHGSAANLLSLIQSNPDKIIFDWNVFTPALDLGAFIGVLQPVKKRKTVKKANSLRSVSNALDNMLEKAVVRLKVKATQLQYKKFHATHVNGSVSLLPDQWTLHNISLAHAGGTMRLNGTVGTGNNMYQPVNISSDIANADIKEIMYAFNDFGQTGIESKNLTGKLTAKANVFMLLNGEELKPSNMKGSVDFSLKQGSLINYEPMQKLQSLLKRRDLNHIYFAELKDHLEINDKEVTINRMEIQSTALSLFVEGIYSMKGNTDISIQIPLNNMKRRGSSYVPVNIGTQTKAGMSVYVRGRPGSDGKIKFSPDVFRKFRKNDQKK